MPLWILAFDHRDSLRTGYLEIAGEPTAADHATARRAKAIIFDGVRRALEIGIPVGQPAILVDEEYGAGVITQAHRHGVTTAVPVEASGRSELAFEHGDDGFGPAIERVDASYAKVLVRYNTGADVARNRRQRTRLLMLQDWVESHGRRWMLELLVPPTPEQLAAAAGQAARFDDELRPALTVGAVDELVGAGLAPDLWKLEGMPTTAAYAEVAAACGADGSDDGPRCLVLGRGADTDAVDRWLSLAAPVPGFAGFAVGRTLWWDPLRKALSGTAGEAEAASAIAANFVRLIEVYLKAAPSPT